MGFIEFMIGPKKEKRESLPEKRKRPTKDISKSVEDRKIKRILKENAELRSRLEGGEN